MLRLTLAAGLVLGGCKKDSIVDPSLPDGDRLAFVTEPTATGSNVPVFPAVRVAIVDSAGNVMTTRNNVDVQLYIDSTDPRDTLQGVTSVATVAGVAIFSSVVLKRAPATFRLIATARRLTGVTSAPFGVTVGRASKVAFSVQPSNVVAGEKMVPAPQVVVQDAQGNFVSSDTGLILLQVFTGPPGTVPRNNAVTAVGGIAKYDSLRVRAASALYSLVAVGPAGITTAVSSLFSVTAAAPYFMAFTVQPALAIKNVAFNPNLKVIVTDSMSNVAQTFAGIVSLEWDFNVDAALINGTVSATAVGGVATWPGISIDRPSNNLRLRAVSPAVPDTARSSFFQIIP